MGIFISKTFSKIREVRGNKYECFEYIHICFENHGCKYAFIILYRPPDSHFGVFCDELRDLLDNINFVGFNTYICGDFNIWYEQLDNRLSRELYELMATYQQKNYVCDITTNTGHMLDLIFGDSESRVISGVRVDDLIDISPVHKLIYFKLPSNRMVPKITKIKFRLKTRFNPDDFLYSITGKINHDKHESCIHSLVTRDCEECFVSLLNNVSKVEYNNACPIIEKEIRIRENAPWYNDHIWRLKKDKRRLERKWHRRRSYSSRREYNEARNRLNYAIKNRKKSYYRNKVTEAGNNIKKLYKILDGLTGYDKVQQMPEGFSNSELAREFLLFFDDKINKIMRFFSNIAPVFFGSRMPTFTDRLSRFTCIDLNELKLIFARVNFTYCIIDPFPVSDVKESHRIDSLLLIYVEIINLCIINTKFPASEKKAIIKPIVKGNMDPHCLSSYKPVSNLSFLSKMIESVILKQLIEFLTAANVLPDEQCV